MPTVKYTRKEASGPNHYVKPLSYVPLGKCQAGCGRDTKPELMTSYHRFMVKGMPRKYCSEECAHSYFRLPEGRCHCGCDQPSPNAVFLPGHYRFVKLGYRVCRVCGIHQHYAKFPPFSETVDYACYSCRMKYRQNEIQADKLNGPGPIGYCQCGCGWITDIATYDNVTRGMVKGQPKPYFSWHGQEVTVLKTTRTRKENAGYKTECVVRAPLSLWAEKPRAKGGARRAYILVAVGPNYPSPKNKDGLMLAQEYAWEQKHGPLTEYQNVVQICGNPRCENLEHLELRDFSPAQPRSDPNYYVEEDPIPHGYCHCGCGQKAPIATETNVNIGHVAGEPVRFIMGHSTTNRWRADFYGADAYIGIPKEPQPPKVEPPTSRICPECKEEKSLFKFDGASTICRECEAAARLAAYAEAGGDVSPVNTAKASPSKEKLVGPLGYSMVPPDGKCMCGCGRTTAIATYNDIERGFIYGEHYPYISGHNPNKRKRSNTRKGKPPKKHYLPTFEDTPTPGALKIGPNAFKTGPARECVWCHHSKPESQFVRNDAGKTGLICLECYEAAMSTAS